MKKLLTLLCFLPLFSAAQVTITSYNQKGGIVATKIFNGNVQIGNGNVMTVNGNKVYTNVQWSKTVKIVIMGNVEQLTNEAGEIEISGSVGSVNSESGTVNVKNNITGNVETMSGDIYCHGEIHGGAKTMSGDINR